MHLSLLALLPLTASFAVAFAPVALAGETCDGRPATIIAVDGRPTRGTEGDDVVVGTEGPDQVDALGGNDVVCGLGGADTLRGGAGDDRIFGGLDDWDDNNRYVGDEVIPGAGDDTIDVGLDPRSLDLGSEDSVLNVDRISWEDSPTGVTVDLATGTAVGEGADTIVLHPAPVGVVGSDGSDVVTGTDRDEWVYTGSGDDIVTSAGGDDAIILGGGDDRVDSGDGDDSVMTGDWGMPGRGADEVVTGPGEDWVVVPRGAAGSRVRTGAGSDRIEVDASADIDTGSGRDHMSLVLRTDLKRFDIAGGPARDDLSVVPRKISGARVAWDNARGRVRTDTALIGRTSGFERLHLHDGVQWRFLGADFGENVRADALAAPVLLRGRGGDDVLTGTLGDDVLDGGTGRDVLRGQRGWDLCLAGEGGRGCESRG